MNIRNTFFASALFLSLVIPNVSHASIFSDVVGWFSGGGVGASSETQTASVGGALPDTASWLHLTANNSHNPVADIAGADVTLRWTVDNVTGVSGCRITYPSSAGDTSLSVAVFGSKTVTMYPSQSRTRYIELVCTKDGVLGRDIVLFASSATPPTPPPPSPRDDSDTSVVQGVSSDTSVVGGVSGDSGGHGVSNTGNGGAATTLGTNAANGGQGVSVDWGGVVQAAQGYINTAQKGTSRTIDRVTSVTGRVIDSVMNFIFGGGNNSGGKPGIGGTGGKPGIGGSGGKPGIGGSGGKPGVTGGKPSGSSGGSGGSGGSVGKPLVPEDDKKPSKPKGK